MRSALLVGFAWIVLITILFCRVVYLESKDQKSLFVSPTQRESITFLLGHDKPGQNFFQLAEQHFLFDSVEHSDQVIKSCPSLLSLVEYLRDKSGNAPWGVINVVVHGNMWGGLSVPLWPEGSRAFPKELFSAACQGAFPLLDSSVIDSQTKVNFWACGIGKNPLINLALEYVFTNQSGDLADLYVSPHFVIFKKLGHQVAPVRIKASYWPFFYRRGYRPSENEIAAELKIQYPDMDMDWESSLKTSLEDTSITDFYDEFHVPVVWTVIYADKASRPDISTVESKMSWIKNQPDLMMKIADLQIPLEKYNWTVQKIIYTDNQGIQQPAIKAIGMCTVLCVISPEV
ncbi:MAG: hypothetical protein HKN76_07725 [Saprospiraceae bacterium]|nr:hypothetical protein [Saprospiraceae bacterium]